MDYKNYEGVWGIDVSKGWLDISIDGKVHRIDQNEKAITHLLTNIKVEGTTILAVAGSTGGYERLVMNCLSRANFIVHIAHPNKVRAYTKARGRIAKTDKLDAKIIEGYGRFIELKIIYDLRTEFEQKLSASSSRLAQLNKSISPSPLTSPTLLTERPD